MCLELCSPEGGATLDGGYNFHRVFDHAPECFSVCRDVLKDGKFVLVLSCWHFAHDASMFSARAIEIILVVGFKNLGACQYWVSSLWFHDNVGARGEVYLCSILGLAVVWSAIVELTTPG